MADVAKLKKWIKDADDPVFVRDQIVQRIANFKQDRKTLFAQSVLVEAAPRYEEMQAAANPAIAQQEQERIAVFDESITALEQALPDAEKAVEKLTATNDAAS